MTAINDDLQSLTLKELLNRPMTPRDFLLEPVLRQGESFMVWAAPGIGKTLFSMTLALTMAGGGTVLDFRSEGGRRVLLIDGEMNLMDLRDRFRDLLPTVDGIDEAKAMEGITILCRQDQSPESEFPDIGTTEGREEVLERARDYDVVILDNLSTLATIEDENSAAAIQPVMKLLLKLKQANVATILVHHAAKGGDKFRGSTAILTTFEVSAGLRKPNTTKLGHYRADFELAFDKFRGIRSEHTRGKRCWLKHDPDLSGLRWAFELSEEEVLAATLEALRTCRFPTQRALAKHLGISQATLSRRKLRANQLHMSSEAEWRACMGEAASEDAPEAAEELDDFNSDF